MPRPTQREEEVEELEQVDYFVKGKKNIERARKETNQGFGKRVPKIWLPEDEPKLLWFNSTEADVAVFQHYIETPKGGQYVPCLNNADCPICEEGKGQTLVNLFVCVDENGYQITKGKRKGEWVTWKLGIMELTSTAAEQLERVLKKADLQPSERNLSRSPIECLRSKQKGKNIHTFQWEPKRAKTPPEIKATKWFSMQDLRNFYALPTLTEMRKIAANML